MADTADTAEIRRAEAARARRGGAFPPHWAGTTITWELSDNPDADGTRVLFRHTGWQPGDPGLPPAAYTWGQLMTRLKEYAETGRPTPFFTP